MLAPDAFSADSKFSDIDGHWAEDTIIKWEDQGIISGYPDGTFKPDAPVTRAELAKILALAFDWQEKSPLKKHEDLDDVCWYYPYVEYTDKYIPIYPLPVSYATNLPYVENAAKGGERFLPKVHAIRMHFAEAIVKIKMEREDLTIELPPFNDMVESAGETFKDPEYEELFIVHPPKVPTNVQRMFEYTYLAKELSVMRGNADGWFVPYNNVSRAEVLTVIDRLLSKLNQLKEIAIQ